MQISELIVAGAGLLALLFIGPTGSAQGQENYVPSGQEAAMSGETFTPDVSEPHEQDASFHGAVDADSRCIAGCQSCGTSARAGCGGYSWVQVCRSTCDMFPHYSYFPPIHGYYYFRPYHYLHVSGHQRAATRWGGDPRNPYSNEVFRRVYAEYSADTAQPQPSR